MPGRLAGPQSAQNVSFEIINSKEVSRSTRTTSSKQVEFQYIQSWQDLSGDTQKLCALLKAHTTLLK